MWGIIAMTQTPGRAGRSGAQIGVFALLLMLVVALSGCVRIDRSIRVNDDGSGTYTLTIGFKRDLATTYGPALVNQMTEYGESVKAKGGTYGRSDDDTYTYWKFSRPFHTPDDLNQALTNLPSLTLGSSTLSSQDQLKLTENSGPFVNDFRLAGKISLLPDGQVNSATQDLFKDAHNTLVITMPGMITSHSGGTQAGNTITYTVGYAQSAEVDVASRAVNWQVVAPAGLVAGGLLGALAIFSLVLALRRPKRDPQQIAPQARQSMASDDYPTTPSLTDSGPTWR
jgi:phosphatidylinositol mannoside-binding LppM-like protein